MSFPSRANTSSFAPGYIISSLLLPIQGFRGRHVIVFPNLTLLGGVSNPLILFPKFFRLVVPKLEEDIVFASALEGVVVISIIIGINPAIINSNTTIAMTGEAIIGINIL